MQNLPTGDVFNSSHKTVQFWQLVADNFEAPFEDDDDDE
jgi:hypothetical protein